MCSGGGCFCLRARWLAAAPFHNACCLMRIAWRSPCPALPLPPPPLQGYRLRQRLQKMRERDPAAVLPEADWQQWLQVGNSLRELDEVLPLDAQDWFAVSGLKAGGVTGGSGLGAEPAAPQPASSCGGAAGWAVGRSTGGEAGSTTHIARAAATAAAPSKPAFANKHLHCLPHCMPRPVFTLPMGGPCLPPCLSLPAEERL